MRHIIFIFISFFILNSALAEVPRKSEDITFEIPQGELSLPTIDPKKTIAPHFIGFEFSSWKPDQLQQESRLPMTTEFSKSSTPKLTFNYISAGADTSIGRLSTKLGFSYLQLEREGQLTIESSNYAVSQKTNLYQALIGSEWKTNREYLSTLRPYANLAIQPTWIQSQKSEFNGGINAVEWPLYFSAGALINVWPLNQWLGVDEMAINVSIEKTQNLNGASISGTGIALGTRIGWN